MGLGAYPPTRKQLAVSFGLFITGASFAAYGAYLSFVNIGPEQARAKARSDFIKERLRKILDGKSNT
uniref:Uncharacterized protein n=1 Tax=Rhizophora mucronata TaxID=61149 RepID=A0A2P2P4L1_RHIMU